MGNYTQLELRRIELKRELSEEKARHTKTMEALNEAYAKNDYDLRCSTMGIDLEVVEKAQAVIYVGDFSRGGAERGSVIEDAIADILAGVKKLRTQYFGTKNYDRWSGQRSDHDYGYAPRHGSIVFSVGLRETVRRSGAELTSEEVEACIYLLRNIERIQKAERDSLAAAKAAA